MTLLSARCLLSAACPVIVIALLTGPLASADEFPNILWITTEDHGPHLGAYGDSYAHTPNMDALAERGLRYEVAWSDAPVCAPARTAIITGVPPTSTGGQHMRSDVRLPEFLLKYPVLLRESGYYVTNNRKEDYNVSGTEPVWDESSRNAHYRNRDDGQPFFAIFNLHESHEARIRDRTDLPHHDPELAPVPPYHPDTPVVRRDWAQYYHSISEVDREVGRRLDELEDAGLADDTIVFVYSDHGGGMPRSKRWPYNSGLQVPLIVYFPEKYSHLAPSDYEPGGSTRRPVAFVDLAPTLLSLIGRESPEWMQGRAFAGSHEKEPRDHVFGFRGRMDERYDMVRSVRDDRYIYIRNYKPDLIYGQHLAYMFITQTTQEWHDLYHQGKLVPPETRFWEPKPPEELYDLKTDPHEVTNLVDSPDHQQIRHELRTVLRTEILDSRDAGFLSEAEMHRRAGDDTIYEMARDPDRYPLEKIHETAELATGRDLSALPRLRETLSAEDPAVRYWAARGILNRGRHAFRFATDAVREALYDDNPSVQLVAAQILIDYGSVGDSRNAIDVLLELAPPDQTSAFVSVAALNILADLDETELAAIRPVIEAMPVEDPNLPSRPNDYVHRLVSDILGEER